MRVDMVSVSSRNFKDHSSALILAPFDFLTVFCCN